jgi:hypothetical protein
MVYINFFMLLTPTPLLNLTWARGRHPGQVSWSFQIPGLIQPNTLCTLTSPPCVEADAIRLPGRKLRNEILAMQVKGLGAPFQPINTQ